MAQGPIQTLPQGLLGLLQLKSLGKNPSELLDQVQPSYDLFEQYVQTLMQGEIGLFGVTPTTAALVSAGHGFAPFANLASPVIPNGEMWWVEAATVYIVGNTLAAADTVVAGAGYVLPNHLTIHTLNPMSNKDIISARARSWSPDPMPRSLWLPPGTTFGIQVFDILSATSITLQMGMRAARVKL